MLVYLPKEEWHYGPVHLWSHCHLCAVFFFLKKKNRGIVSCGSQPPTLSFLSRLFFSHSQMGHWFLFTFFIFAFLLHMKNDRINIATAGKVLNFGSGYQISWETISSNTLFSFVGWVYNCILLLCWVGGDS